MEPNVPAARLATHRKGELVDVRAQVADPVQRGGGGVRDHRHVGIVQTLPCRYRGIDLEPGSTQREVVGWVGAADSVHSAIDSLEQPVFGQARESGPSHPSLLRLLTSDEAPLLLGHLGDALNRSCHTAQYNTPVSLCSVLCDWTCE